jgi:hypothetical protein
VVDDSEGRYGTNQLPPARRVVAGLTSSITLRERFFGGWKSRCLPPVAPITTWSPVPGTVYLLIWSPVSWTLLQAEMPED